MTKFKVFTKSIGYCYAIVEAENVAQANEIADEMDGGDFKEYDVGWVIEEEKTEEIFDESEARMLDLKGQLQDLEAVNRWNKVEATRISTKMQEIQERINNLS